MAVKLIRETEVIEVTSPPVLIYGQPGAGKTSLAQTAPKPLTLDFDGGAHRSAFRKTILRFETWEEVIDAQRNGLTDDDGSVILEPDFVEYQTLVLDTVGTLLKFIARAIVKENAKNGNKSGGLSISGYGVLKDTFDGWLAGLRAAGKQVIMIAHEKEEKDGDARMLRPDIQGGSYGIVMQSADVVGYLSYRNNRRWIEWNPTDSFFAKNGAQLKSGAIPSFGDVPAYMSSVLTEAKANLGKTAEASAAMAKLVDEWQTWLASDPTLAAVNARLGEVSALQNGTKKQVAHLLKTRMEAAGYVYDRESKQYVPKPQEAA